MQLPQIPQTSKPHLLTVAEYMTADIQGRTELIAGIVYDVSPRNEPHRYAVRMLTKLLVKGLGAQYTVQAKDAVAVTGWHGKDAPEIDIAVLAEKFYDPMPTSAEAFAFIEVSDTTYGDDRRIKIPLYVNSGVPAWIVNIPKRQVEFYESVDDLATQYGRVFGDRDIIDVLGVAIPVVRLFAPTNF